MTDGGVDSDFSLEPDELAALVRRVGTGAWRRSAAPPSGRPRPSGRGCGFRRSLFVVADVRAGDAVTAANVRSIRPAGGLPPVEIDRVLGRTFTTDVPKAPPSPGPS